MQSVDADDARAMFDALLAAVENGVIVEITRDGVPIARLEPVTPSQKSFADAAAMEAIHRLRRQRRPTLGGITIRELIEEGRE